MKEEIPVLHMHGQLFWHGEAYLVANRNALEDLKVAVDKALRDGTCSQDMCAADGEGYDLRIQLIDRAFDSEEWQCAALPYTEEDARDKRPDAIWPWNREGRGN